MTDKHAYENRIEIAGHPGHADPAISPMGPNARLWYRPDDSVKDERCTADREGSLYSALHRLERQRWVKSKWGINDSKQRAKFYTITLLGKQQMISDHERWQVLVKAVGAIMSPKQKPL